MQIWTHPAPYPPSSIPLNYYLSPKMKRELSDHFDSDEDGVITAVDFKEF